MRIFTIVWIDLKGTQSAGFTYIMANDAFHAREIFESRVHYRVTGVFLGSVEEMLSSDPKELAYVGNITIAEAKKRRANECSDET